MIRIRSQVFGLNQKRASVTIMSVDEFTRYARRIDKSRSERRHLMGVLDAIILTDTDNPYTLIDDDFNAYHFWVEKQ